MKRSATTICATILVLCLFSANLASAAKPIGDNMLGQRGLLRLSDAANHPKGWLTVGTNFEFFKASNFLVKGFNHGHFANSYAISWTPWQFLEFGFALHMSADESTLDDVEDAREGKNFVYGNGELWVKGSYTFANGFSVGGLLNPRFISGAGFLGASPTPSFYMAALASWFGGSKLPLAFHLNFGFYYDGSKNIFDLDANAPKPVAAYSAELSSFHRLILRVGAEYDLVYVGPFVELSMEPYLGDAGGFSNSPTRLSLGLRGWPFKSRNVQLAAAVDIGLTGVSTGGPDPDLGDPAVGDYLTEDGTKYLFKIPRWNLVFRLSYRFDPFMKPAVDVKCDQEKCKGLVPAGAGELGYVVGKIAAADTGNAIGNAQISVDGSNASPLLAKADGTFQSFGLPAGKYTAKVSADGYEAKTVNFSIASGGESEIDVQLGSRVALQPGTIRGKVTDFKGKIVRKGTILIPQLDRKIEIQKDGTFDVTVAPGEYNLVINVAGYRTQRKTIEIQENGTAILNIEMFR